MSRWNSRQLTQQRHRNMVTRVRVLKINTRRMSLAQLESIDRLFLEAKWYKNYIIAESGKIDTKVKLIPIKTPTEVDLRELKVIGSQTKQQLLRSFCENCKGLNTKKANGHTIGRIRFCKEVNSIPLVNQQIKIQNNRINIAKLGKMRFHGNHQLVNLELASGNLVRKPSGLYLHIVTHVEHTVSNIKATKLGEVKHKQSPKIDAVGIDLGIKSTLTTSDGHEFNLRIGESDHLKNLQRKFSKSIKGSNNRKKLQVKIRREYEHVSNQRKDMANKICNILSSTYQNIVIQDENIKGWHSGWFGKQVQYSCLGTIKSKLIASGAIVIPRLTPTTKQCHICGEYNNLSLYDRMFHCSSCGHEEHRDIKAAKSILFEAGFSCSTNAIFEVVEFNINQPTYFSYNMSGSDVGMVPNNACGSSDLGNDIRCGFIPEAQELILG